MIQPVDVSQPLTPLDTPVLEQWAQVQSNEDGGGGGSAQAQRQGLPLTKAAAGG